MEKYERYVNKNSTLVSLWNADVITNFSFFEYLSKRKLFIIICLVYGFETSLCPNQMMNYWNRWHGCNNMDANYEIVKIILFLNEI